MQATAEISEKELWLRVHQNDDVKAMEILFKMYYQGLCRFSQRLVQSESAAEDIVQNAMVQFWEKRNTIRIENSIKSYMYRSVHNASLNALKREQRLSYMDEQSDEAMLGVKMPVDDTLSELQKRISKAIATLPDKCRMVFLLSREKELKYSEIAEAMDISIKTVENHMNKALKTMHAQLGDLLICLLALILGGGTNG